MAQAVRLKIDELLHFLFPGKCYEESLLMYNFLHQECLSMFVSRMLGLGITVASMMLFIPQILKIQFAQSAEGISLSSQLLGLLACFSMTAYSYARRFVAIIVVQILWFSARRAHAAVFVAFCWTLACAVTGDYIPFSVLACLQAITIPVIIAAKVLQIL
ncbi:unnamed protein product [Gongylonema pulchrum]|uniref:MFS_1_like domain-containing protein n=1 Tax=Gongylonema pulchrum TaxID=637853 RepID=A0A183E926_9BILA|nr:unnamed protein product [Gongylonema pulchrum]